MLSVDEIIAQMARQAERIRVLAEGVSDEQARWKPDAESWSLLEVVNHLYDEEREDFRRRLDLTLHHPEQEWPPIDPQGWVVERAYNQRELGRSLESFLDERRASLSWLGSLVRPDWALARQHPSGFTISAGDLLVSWVGHDFLHLRQLVELQRAYLARQAAPYTLDYAGEW